MLNIFKVSGVFIVNFEQVNANWEMIYGIEYCQFNKRRKAAKIISSVK